MEIEKSYEEYWLNQLHAEEDGEFALRIDKEEDYRVYIIKWKHFYWWTMSCYDIKSPIKSEHVVEELEESEGIDMIPAGKSPFSLWVKEKKLKR